MGGPREGYVGDPAQGQGEKTGNKVTAYLSSREEQRGRGRSIILPREGTPHIQETVRRLLAGNRGCTRVNSQSEVEASAGLSQLANRLWLRS